MILESKICWLNSTDDTFDFEAYLKSDEHLEWRDFEIVNDKPFL